MLAGTIFLAVFVGLANSAPWLCAPGIITADVSNNNAYFFPNATLEPWNYFSPQSCRWALTVPAGKYAYLTAYLKLNKKDTFTISNGGTYNHGYDSVNNDVPRDLSARFNIPPGYYTISFTSTGTQTNGSLSFNVYLKDLPTKIDYPVDANLQQVVLLSTFIGKQFSLPSNRTFTLRTIPSDCDVNNYMYDACQVYKGKNAATGTFVAGLSQFFKGVPSAFVPGAGYTVVCFGGVDHVPDNSRLLVTGMPTVPSGSTWQVTSNCPYFSLTGFGANDAYATDFCDGMCTKYLNNVQFFNSTATLYMYTGSISSSYSLLGTLNKNAVGNRLPQIITGGYFKTFRVSKGTAVISLSSDSAYWSTASPRTGFIASPYYGISSNNQTFSTSISSLGQYTYTYTVNDIQSGNLQVRVNKNGSPYQVSHTKSDFNPNQQYSVVGNGITFNYDMGSGPSKGVMVHYGLTPFNSASTGALLFAFISLLASIF